MLKITWLLTLVSYSFIVSQSLIYIIALRDVQMHMDAAGYTRFRVLLDRNFRKKFRYPFFTSFLTTILLVILTGSDKGNPGFIPAIISLVALAGDTFFMLSGNLPVNRAINTWTADTVPADWKDYRDRWMKAFRYRQFCNITGFLSLLYGVVFR